MSPTPSPTVEPDGCQIRSIHPRTIRSVAQKMPENRLIREAAAFFKLFGDETRLRILSALSLGELCVCDLCVLLGMKQPAISHQLRTLKQARIVRPRRDGKVVFYSLRDEHIRNVVEMGLEHLCESEEQMEAWKNG